MTPDFPQEYNKLNGPSCGDPVRPGGETAAAEATTAVGMFGKNVWGIIRAVGRFRFWNEM